MHTLMKKMNENSRSHENVESDNSLKDADTESANTTVDDEHMMDWDDLDYLGDSPFPRWG